jgi:hypothetical protein
MPWPFRPRSASPGIATPTRDGESGLGAGDHVISERLGGTDQAEGGMGWGG